MLCAILKNQLNEKSPHGNVNLQVPAVEDYADLGVV